MRHQDIRRLIRSEMLAHSRRHPLAKPLSPKQIQARHPDWPLSTIYYHMAAIRAEVGAAASWKDSNSDTSEKAA